MAVLVSISVDLSQTDQELVHHVVHTSYDSARFAEPGRDGQTEFTVCYSHITLTLLACGSNSGAETLRYNNGPVYYYIYNYNYYY